MHAVHTFSLTLCTYIHSSNENYLLVFKSQTDINIFVVK